MNKSLHPQEESQEEQAALQETVSAEPPSPPEPVPPVVVLRPSSDGMELELLFQKAGEPTANPVYEEVMAAIAEKGVTHGLNTVAIRALCDNPVYNRTFIVAKGTPAKTGKDGELTYLIHTTRDLRPKLREDGTVDYRDLGFTQNVSKGQPLCEIHHPEKGADGMDIYGQVLEGKTGKDAPPCAGKNTEYNEDTTLLLAMCDGSAEVKRGIVEVIDVLRVAGNVDNSTGDIQFVGDIFIGGDVVSGFRVTSERSITVKGSVEGATLQAAGDIVVSEGINGMGRGSVVAGGNLKCKYIQSSFIKAAGDIYADSIMYCTLECGGNVELNGKRATLIGGRSSIAGKLLAKTIGTESHVATYITMASTGMQKNRELQELAETLKRVDEENVKMLQIMARYEDLLKRGKIDAEMAKTILSVKQQYLAQVERRNQLVQRQEEIKREQLEASRENSYIECKDRVHVGVQITFGPILMSVQNSFVYSRISIVGNDIAVQTL